jgi:hypothetical protein
MFAKILYRNAMKPTVINKFYSTYFTDDKMYFFLKYYIVILCKTIVIKFISQNERNKDLS